MIKMKIKTPFFIKIKNLKKENLGGGVYPTNIFSDIILL